MTGRTTECRSYAQKKEKGGGTGFPQVGPYTGWALSQMGEPVAQPLFPLAGGDAARG